MARIEAFRAFRAPGDKMERVVTRTADSYTPAERKKLLQENSDSFLHVIFPEGTEKKRRSLPNTKERFEKVRQRFDTFCEQGIFLQEERPALYLYELQTPEARFLGFIGTAAVEDQEQGVIRKHEQTLEKREELLKEYLKVCDINADPVLLAYPDRTELERLMRVIGEESPDHAFRTEDDGRHHRLWAITDPERIASIQNAFERIPALYIADGHHRSASSVRLAQELRKKEGKRDEGSEQFMAYFIPESQLLIHGYHRCIKDLNGLDKEQFLKRLSERFQLLPSTDPIAPSTLHEFGLYIDGEWYRLHPDPSCFDHQDPVGSLDASILYEQVLAPILDVRDPRKSERVHFHGAPKGLDPMLRSIEQGKYRLAFTLAPVPVDQLKEVADQGRVMPPKTTWIEPKLRSGLLIYRMGLHKK